jgi:glycerophosphoryl diester phosphodiesterase
MRGALWLGLFLLSMIALRAPTSTTQAADLAPLKQAHAHNDYLHDRPLLDAVDHGFASVEADIFLVDGELLVAHTRREIQPQRTLQKLYLDPLRERIKDKGGSVHGDGKPFHLLIDLKTAGEPTYAALDKVLSQYADLLSTVKDGKLQRKAVDISISGDRPIATITAAPLRYVGIDGRLGDLDSQLPTHLLPIISDNWAMNFRWRGEGEFKPAERQKLHDIVKKAHAAGRQIRFWASPDTVAAWSELQAAGVDMINTDDLAGLEAFLRGQNQANK